MMLLHLSGHELGWKDVIKICVLVTTVESHCSAVVRYWLQSENGGKMFLDASSTQQLYTHWQSALRFCEMYFPKRKGSTR